MKDIFELDEEEQQIENEIDQYVPADEETQATVRRIAQESRKRKNVNIRNSEHDLSQIRERASREGVPYQTLIARRYWCGVTREIKHFIGLSGVLMMTVAASGSDRLRGVGLARIATV